MSRHRLRLLPDGRYMCSRPRCRFVGTYQDGVSHINAEMRKREEPRAA